MTTGLSTIPSFFRGQSIRWLTQFTDFDGNIVQPATAVVKVFADTTSGDDQVTTVTLTQQSPGNPSSKWIGTLDTRGFLVGKVQWSIEAPNPGSVPIAVEDGFFMLTANQANVPTF